MHINEAHFPELPAYQAYASPVFIEPIIGSGERICVGVVAKGQDDAFIVVQTIKEDAVTCMLGAAAPKLLNLIDIALNSLNTYIKDHRNFTDWRSPVPGINLGKPVKGYVKDLTMMVRTVARNHAFLSSMSDFSAADVSVAQESQTKDRWLDQVKSATLNLNDTLSYAFNRQFKLTSKGSTRFDFVGQQLAAQLGRIIPGHGISGLVKTAKAKLWDLETLREFNEQQLINNLTQYELIVYRPKDNDPAYTENEIIRLNEALVELEETGDKQQLRVVSTYTAEEAAQRIYATEAA